MQNIAVAIVFCATFQLSAGERQDKLTFPQCVENQWLNRTVVPPVCSPCTTCTGDENYTIRECSKVNNTICSFCPKEQVWSPIEFKCKRCGVCSPDHQIQLVCLAANANKPCIEDAANAANKPEPEQKPLSSDTVTRPTTAENPKISTSTEDSKKSIIIYALALGLGLTISVTVIVIGIIFFILLKKRRKTKKTNTHPSDKSDNSTNDPEAEIPLSKEETGEANSEPCPQGVPSSTLDEPSKINIHDQTATYTTNNTAETTT